MEHMPAEKDEFNVVIANTIISDWVDVTHTLYQPLIGNVAVSLYATLMSMAKLENNKILQIPHSELLSITGIKMKDFSREIKKLSEINLISIHMRAIRKKIIFVYSLKSPLTAEQYFNNSVLSELLSGRLKSKHLSNRFIGYFTKPLVNINAHEEINYDFSDFYKKLKKSIEDTSVISINGPKVELEMKKLKSLLVQNGIDAAIVSNKKMSEEVSFTILMYGLSILDIVNIMRMLQGNKISVDTFKKAVKSYIITKQTSSFNEIKNSQPLSKKNKNVPDDLRVLVQQCEDNSPATYLMMLMGRSGTMDELSVIENMMRNYSVMPAVINIVLNYIVIQKRNQIINPVYFEKIIGSLVKAKIDTVIGAINFIASLNSKYTDNDSIADDDENIDIKMDQLEKLF